MIMDEEVVFYQIRIFKKGQIEIMQNVYHHALIQGNFWLYFRRSASKNVGLTTVGCRCVKDAYKIDILYEQPYFDIEQRLGLNSPSKLIIDGVEAATGERIH